MPFAIITAQTLPFEPRSEGHYVRSNVAFGAPDNSFVIRGANAKSEPLRASVSRVLQKDITIAGNTVRKTATVTLAIVVPTADFTALELDSLATDISEFLTSNTATRLLMGES